LPIRAIIGAARNDSLSLMPINQLNRPSTSVRGNNSRDDLLQAVRAEIAAVR
jgi:hypothetical protein